MEISSSPTDTSHMPQLPGSDMGDPFSQLLHALKNTDMDHEIPPLSYEIQTEGRFAATITFDKEDDAQQYGELEELVKRLEKGTVAKILCKFEKLVYERMGNVVRVWWENSQGFKTGKGGEGKGEDCKASGGERTEGNLNEEDDTGIDRGASEERNSDGEEKEAKIPSRDYFDPFGGVKKRRVTNTEGDLAHKRRKVEQNDADEESLLDIPEEKLPDINHLYISVAREFPEEHPDMVIKIAQDQYGFELQRLQDDATRNIRESSLPMRRKGKSRTRPSIGEPGGEAIYEDGEVTEPDQPVDVNELRYSSEDDKENSWPEHLTPTIR